MTSLLPLASYNLALNPFTPTQAIESDLPVTVHLTLAAIDPEGAIDDDEQPSTLRILKSSAFSNLDEDSEDDSDFEDELSEDGEDAELNEDEEDSEDSEEDKIQEDGDSEEDDENDEDFDEEDDEIEEYVVCTLSPKSQYQQTLDLTISPDEEVFFVVTGSYPIHLSGNFVEHPYDGEDSEFDSDEDSEDEYDLSPDEDEIIDGEDFDINDLEDESDVEGKIEELVEEEEAKKIEPTPKESKKSKKRQVEEVAEVAKPEPKETKKQKKAKEEKNVKFNKELEQGPTESKKESAKPSTKTLPGGVVVEDRTVGKGPTAKNGSKVGVRYIGKLKNGSVFDKNTSGKPFSFGLGKGEVIKGWDVGVAGMAVGGERRIVIPSKMAYGSQKLPGIPANSELTFDVKLVSIK